MKPIKLLPIDEEKMRADFEEQLAVNEENLRKEFEKKLKTATATSTFEFKHEFKFKYEPTESMMAKKPTDQKVEIFFKKDAFRKMMGLINKFSTEVAWHGLVERHDEFHYTIDDILVYPQTVTGSFVDMDTEKYADWLGKLDIDDHCRMKMQGHSHVYMSVFPSGEDRKHQNDILSLLNKKSFYIFLIVNKRRECWAAVYDMATNTLYENADIELLSEADDVEEFLEASSEMVKSKYTSGWTSNGTTNKPATTAASKSTPAVAIPATSKPAETKKTETKKEEKAQTQKEVAEGLDEYYEQKAAEQAAKMTGQRNDFDYDDYDDGYYEYANGVLFDKRQGCFSYME